MPRSSIMFFVAALFGIARTNPHSATLPLFIQLLLVSGLLVSFGLGAMFAWKDRKPSQ